MEEPRLPYEVILLAMEKMLPRDVSACMKTCRVLYQLGAKILLDKGVSLSQRRHFTSFRRFMLVQKDARFQHFHKLEIVAFPWYSDVAIDALRDIITHPCLCLRTLILLDAEATLSPHHPSVDTESVVFDKNSYFQSLDSLGPKFSALTTLHHVTVSAAGSRTEIFLRYLRSSLRSAHLDLAPRPLSSSSEATAAAWRPNSDQLLPHQTDPRRLLAASASTLELLSGTGFTFLPSRASGNLPQWPVTQTSTRRGHKPPIFPRVRSLAFTYDPKCITWLHIAFHRSYLLGICAQTFPALTHLSFAAHMPDRPGEGSDSGFNIDPHRDESEGPAWPDLEEVRAPLPDLLQVADARRNTHSLRPIARIQIVGGVIGGQKKRLGDLLAATCPELLAVSFVGAEDAFGEAGQRVGMVLRRTAGTEKLKVLELSVRFKEDEGGVDVGTLLVSGTLLHRCSVYTQGRWTDTGQHGSHIFDLASSPSCADPGVRRSSRIAFRELHTGIRSRYMCRKIFRRVHDAEKCGSADFPRVTHHSFG